MPGVPRQQGDQTVGAAKAVIMPYKDPAKRRACQVNRYRKIKGMVDARVCVKCHYAFISKGGQNVCSDCWYEFRLKFSGRNVRPKRMKAVLCERGLPRHARIGTVVPAIAIPNMDSPFVRLAINDMFEKMKRSSELGEWIVNASPRITAIPSYPHLRHGVFPSGRRISSEGELRRRQWNM